MIIFFLKKINFQISPVFSYLDFHNGLTCQLITCGFSLSMNFPVHFLLMYGCLYGTFKSENIFAVLSKKIIFLTQLFCSVYISLPFTKVVKWNAFLLSFDQLSPSSSYGLMLLFLIDKNHCDLGPTIIFLGLFVKFPSISTSLDISGRQRAVRMVRTVDDPFLTLTYVKKHYVISELEPLCYPSLPTAWHILLLLRLCQVSLFCVYHTFVKS